MTLTIQLNWGTPIETSFFGAMGSVYKAYQKWLASHITKRSSDIEDFPNHMVNDG